MATSELPELAALERIIELGGARLDTRTVCEVSLASGARFPVHAVALGNPSIDVPAWWATLAACTGWSALARRW